MILTMKQQALLALLAAAMPASAQPGELPARIVHSHRQIDVAADGSTVTTVRVETRLLTPAAITSLGQIKLNYREMLQEIEVKEAYTLKPDGQKLMVKPEAIITQQAPASQNAAMLDDTKQKVIIFPNLEVGDSIVQESVTRSKPLLAGNFMYDTLFPLALPIDDADIVVTAPRSLPLMMDTDRLDVAKVSDCDRVTYTVHYSNLKPSAAPAGQSVFDVSPRLSLSSFKSYDALAKAYAGDAMAMAALTPAIQARADQITAGVTGKRDQARKLYDWVSAHVRYVALEFGRGGIIPHSADSVLANGYGDCKDHAVLFTALLKARGIDGKLVVINATDSQTVAKVATMAPFNHVITWLPEFHMYADTTAGKISPFGVLPAAEYGKPVMHVDDRSALHQVPVNDGRNAAVTYKLTEISDDAGHVTSTSNLTAKGDFVVPLRALGLVTQGRDGAKLAEEVLKKSSTPRATGTLAMTDGAEPDSFQVLASYSTPGVLRQLADGANVGLRDNLRTFSPFSTAFFGPLINDKTETPGGACYNGHALDEETLQFPASRKLGKLPADTRLDSAHVSYAAHWSAGEHSVTVHRELTTKFEQNFCTGAARAEMMVLADRLKDDMEETIAIPRDAVQAP